MLTRVKRLRKLRGRPLQPSKSVSLACTYQIFKVFAELGMCCRKVHRWTCPISLMCVCNMLSLTSSLCGEDRTSTPASSPFLQRVLSPEETKAGVALERLAQLGDEHLCPVVQHGVEALQDALACHKHAGQSGQSCTSSQAPGGSRPGRDEVGGNMHRWPSARHRHSLPG